MFLMYDWDVINAIVSVTELVNMVADEFDELVKFCSGDYDEIENPEYDEIKKKAFSDLAFIFDDLAW